MPAGYYRVVYKVNPFSEVSHFAKFHTSQSVGEVIRNLNLPYSDRLEIYIAGTHVPRSAWDRVRPNSGVDVHVRMVPGLEGAVALLSSLAGAYTKSWLVSAGVSQFLASALGAVASGLVQAGLSELFGLNKGPPSYEDALNPDIRAQGNRANYYGTVPVVLGKHRMTPPYGGVPFTETQMGSRYLRMLMIWGYGPVSISKVKIGEQAIGKYDEVEEEHDLDGTETGLDLYPRDADQQSFQTLLESLDGYHLRTTAVDTKQIVVAFAWPSGLYTTSSKGNRGAYQVTLQGQYRLVGAGTWTDWFNEDFPGEPIATGSAIYRKKRVTGLPEGKYEVRIKRVDESGQEKGSSKYNDAVYWTDLTSFSGQRPVNISGIAKSAYRIRATDQLNGVVGQLNAVVALKVPTWNGSIWTGETESSNPAALYRWVLTGPANGNPVSASRVDDDALGDWYDFCVDNDLEYNRVILNRAPVKDILKEVAAAGYASPTVTDNKWSVVVDNERSTVVQHFTPRNTWNFASQIVFPDIPHALRLRFFNENHGYLEDERIVYDEGYSQGNATKFQVARTSGITRPKQAWKMGRRVMKAMRLRPEIFTFNCDVEGLVATRGDLIRFTHDVPKIGTHFGRVAGKVGNVITLDEVITMEAGTTYTFRFRGVDGSSNKFNYVCTVSGEYTSVDITGISGVAVDDLFQFGPKNEESVKLLVQGIEPANDLSMKLTCIPYQAELYKPQQAPDYDSVLTEPLSLSLMGPTAPIITSLVSDERAMRRIADGSVVPGIRVSIKDAGTTSTASRTVPTEHFRVRFRQTSTTGSADDFPWTYLSAVPVDAPTVLIEGVDQGIAYDVHVQAVGAGGEVSNWTTENGYAVEGGSASPPVLSTFELNTRDGITYLEWTYDDEPVDLKNFVIRYHHSEDITDWNTMLPLARAVPRTARTFSVPTRSGSYAIKARDTSGNLSEALFVNATEVDDDAYQSGEMLSAISEIENPAWDGTRTGTYVLNNQLRLDTSDVMADWTTLASVAAIGAGADAETTAGEIAGYYEFGATDLGAVFTPVMSSDATAGLQTSMNAMAEWSTLSVVETLAGDAEGSDTDIVIQFARSTVDSATPTYGDWRELFVGNVTARHIKFRVKLSTTNGSISPSLSALTINGRMAPRKQADNNISSGAGAKAITFDRAFYASPSIGITGQNMATGDYYVLSSISSTGFTVTFKNSGGTDVDRTFDWVAIGHGREAA